MKLTIENTGKFYNNADAWFQAWLYVGELRWEIGRSFFDYHDCVNNAETIVKEFSKEKVLLVSNEIYDLHP